MSPLDDVIVIELCRADTPLHIRLAMAMTGRLTADQGARLICLTSMSGDPVETVPPFLPDGSSATHLFLTAGKQILPCPDPEAFAQAIEDAILLEPAAVILAEGDPAHRRMREAGIAVITLASWPEGSREALEEHPVNAFGVMASSGLLDIVGDPDREPLRLGGHQICYSAGMSAFTALIAAILQRDNDGRPLHAHISLLETAVWMNWKAVVGAAEPGPHTTRRGDKTDFPVLRCKDGWVALVYTMPQFQRVQAMFAELALPDLRLLKPAERAEALALAVAPWFAARTRAEIYAAAREFGIPIGPAYTPAELLEDEQYLARDFFAEQPEGSGLRFPRPPLTWNGRRIASKPTRTLTPGELKETAA